MPDAAVSALTAVVTPVPATDTIYVVQGGASKKAVVNQYVGNLIIESAHVLALQSGTSAQQFLAYNTYTDASNYERAFFRWASNVLEIGNEKAGSGSTRVLSIFGGTYVTFYTAGVPRAYFDPNGDLNPNSNNTYDCGTTSFRWRTIYAATSIVLSDGCNIVCNTTTGTKIGTATTQKIGFWNATPVVQSTAVADAAGGAVIDTEGRVALNALLARLRTVGILAT